MTDDTRRHHWDSTYAIKGETGVSWFETRPETSLDLIRDIGATPQSAIIDIGGGASRLVDALLEAGWRSVAVLDIADSALSAAKSRLGDLAEQVEWIAADVTKWSPVRTYDVWHDRAAFHFLTEPQDCAAYAGRLGMAVRPGGTAIIATFAPDGPERCSGLPVTRYDAAGLAAAAGPLFELVAERRHTHSTPWGSPQAFQYAVLRRSARQAP
jgi:SAM-dependent methyltransferase